MKKIIIFLLFSLIFIPKQLQAGEVTFSPDDYIYHDNVPTFQQQLENMFEISRYFDSKYPSDAINEDMTDDVSRFFPEMTEKQNEKMQKYIRKGLSFYRYVRKLYQEYQAKLLMPENPPLLLEDAEYANNVGTTQEYIESKDDTIVISDIKTIVPYTNSPRDIKSIRAKFQRDINENKRTFDGLVNVFGKIEWKKLPFYGVLYPSPLSGMHGSGDWDKVDDIRVRLLSEYGDAKGIDQIRGVIDIVIPFDKYITANDGLYSKPQISFEASDNLKNWDVFLPIPIRIIMPDNKDRSAYIYKTSIPVIFYPENSDKPINIKSDITLDVCNQDDICESKHFAPELSLANNTEEYSAVNNFVYQQHINKPQSNIGKLKVNGFNIQEMLGDKQYLEINVTAKKKINDLRVFINSPDHIAFETPRVAIDGKHAKIRFLPLQQDINLDNKEFEITFVINNGIYYYFQQGAAKSTATLPITQKINFKFILFAVLGGLILNFMPCVFPVLAIKIFSLTKFGATRAKNVRRNFFYTILGIFSSFLLLATFLAVLKHIGTNIGWGMQFQNSYFIITIIFAILVFWLIVCGTIKIYAPKWTQKITKKSKTEELIYFLTGTLAVLMSTPCTAPYLGTAVGFALSGSITDIYVIIMSVAFGLALPYITFIIFPRCIELMPMPGPWMQILNKIMAFMLLLTIAWLFSVILPQTNIYFVIRLGIYVILSAILIWLISLNGQIEYDKSEKINDYVRKRIKNIGLIIVCILYIAALIDGKFSYQRHREEMHLTSQESETLKKIENYVQDGKTVLVSVGADWCLTCHYNNLTTLELPTFKSLLKSLDVETIDIDWTNYNQDVLSFMKKHQRSGLPFYIIFSPLAPEGVVLPEILQEKELGNLIRNFTVTQPEP